MSPTTRSQIKKGRVLKDFFRGKHNVIQENCNGKEKKINNRQKMVSIYLVATYCFQQN